MPYKEKDIEKIYWSIGEVSEMLNVPQSSLRFWEQEFDTIQPKKNRKGDRFYKKEDIEILKMIHHLLKENGYTLKGAKQKMLQHTGETQAQLQAIEMLKKIREFLVQIKGQL